ncbi:MAG: hypothetical protein HY361_00845 [Candidatus Aenigmarchaeota archaeon]|nr:hypothetical protein [Candidatus Aenigmarchaeota archaeon]
MVQNIADKGRKVYKCSICGFGYTDNAIAKKCEDFCKKHGACSLEITKHAVLRGNS